MAKWYEVPEEYDSSVVYSRVRLVRNLAAYPFPGKMTDEESHELTGKIMGGLKHLGMRDQTDYRFADVQEMTQVEKTALVERKVLNRSILKKIDAGGMILSADERVGITVNGEDHVRIQAVEKGLNLSDCLRNVNHVDDYIGERFDYAYDEKYGYLTSFPTNVGTGLRASVIVHLPMLSRRKNFNTLVADMGRFGTTIRGVYGEGSENYGSLYRISNQKTLGQSEKDLTDLVYRAAAELDAQERRIRKGALLQHRIVCEDEAYKSYGVLKYARRLSRKDSMEFLSQIMAGVSAGILEMEEPCSIFELMLGVQPANLLMRAKRPLRKEEVEEERAEYLRMKLPQIR